MSESTETLTTSRIFRFWSPLAATWLLMAVEGPLLAAVIARLVEPRVNLAAYGVAYACGLVVEAPVIMLLGATTALCRGRDSYRRLRLFSLLLCGGVTALLGLLVLPPVFDLVGGTLLGLHPEVAERARLALLVMLPWPAAIGLRRFYQGVLISSGQTRRVAAGTITRVLGMALTALFFAWSGGVAGAVVGGAALAVGVTVEALVSRRLARPAIATLLQREDSKPVAGLRGIWQYYLPLALTPFIALSVQPLVTFFLSRGVAPLESLAVLPVLYGVTFIFRALGLSYQEAAIALVGDRFEGRQVAGRFALWLALFCTVTLGLLALTPLADLWLRGVSGLSRELAEFSRLPLVLMALMPALTVWITWQRSLLVVAKVTGPVSTATAIEALTVCLLLVLAISRLAWPGITLAAVAMLAGRLLSIVYLQPHCRRAVLRVQES